MPIYLALKTLHILSTAAWFGSGLGLPGDIRRTLEQGRPHADLLVSRVTRSYRILFGGAILTVLTGLGLIFHLGGFARVGSGIHAGFGITLIILLMEVILVRPTWGRIAGIIRTGGPDLDEAKRLAGRLAMLHGIEHLLWLGVLILMVSRV